MATENVQYLLSIKDVNFQSTISGATTRLSGLRSIMASIGPALAVGGIVAGIGKIISVSGNFEKSMSNVKALTGATGEEFNMLEQQAKDLGETTAFSASQSAEAMGFLAMAGFETNEIMSALPQTLNLAAAGSVELGEAADFASNILSGYGFEAEQLGAVNDVLVKTFTSTNTTLGSLAESLKDAGPVASGFGLQFTEVAAAVGLLGNAGIQGSKAGRSLKNAFVQLAVPTDAVQKTLDRLGISVRDSGGNLESMTSIIQQLETSGANTTDIMQIFGRIAGPSMAALVSQGSGELIKLQGELESAGGIAGEIAATKLDNFQGRLTILMSALEGVAINIGELLLPVMSALVVGITEVIGFVSENIEIFGIITAGIAAYAAVLLAAKVATLATSFATGIMTAGQWLLNIALNANPIGAVIIALTALAAAFVFAWKHSENFRGTLTGVWEVMKVIGQNAFDIIVKPVLAVGEVFQGIVDIFTGKGFSKLFSGIKNLGQSLMQNLLLPFVTIAEIIDEVTGTNIAGTIQDFAGIKGLASGVGDAAKEGFSSGVADFRKEAAESLEVEGEALPGIASLGGGVGVGDAAAAAGLAAGAGEQIKGEVQGAEGSKLTNINIRIDKLVDKMEINAATLTEGAGQIRDMISEVLLTAVNDVNLIS